MQFELVAAASCCSLDFSILENIHVFRHIVFPSEIETTPNFSRFLAANKTLSYLRLYLIWKISLKALQILAVRYIFENSTADERNETLRRTNFCSFFFSSPNFMLTFRPISFTLSLYHTIHIQRETLTRAVTLGRIQYKNKFPQ